MSFLSTNSCSNAKQTVTAVPQECVQTVAGKDARRADYATTKYVYV